MSRPSSGIKLSDIVRPVEYLECARDIAEAVAGTSLRLPQDGLSMPRGSGDFDDMLAGTDVYIAK